METKDVMFVNKYFDNWQGAVTEAKDSGASLWTSDKYILIDNVFAIFDNDLYILVADGPTLYRWKQGNTTSVSGLKMKGFV